MRNTKKINLMIVVIAMTFANAIIAYADGKSYHKVALEKLNHKLQVIEKRLERND